MCMKKILFTASWLIIIHINSLIGQDNRPRYWISFTDKVHTPYSMQHPEEFLSAKSIERRTQQNIAVMETDLPVDPSYIDSISSLGLRIVNTSKWLNGVLVSTDDSLLIDSIQYISFIKGPAQKVKPRMLYQEPDLPQRILKNDIAFLSAPYGYSSNQIEMLHGDYFHQQGIHGEGMLIAILDAGFDRANSISSLAHVWNDNRIISVKDFVKDELDIFDAHHHGTLVFSIIAGVYENILYGSAPGADFALIRTEDGSSEYLVEEYNWVCGAEFADSLGADIINSSLGYSLFNDSTQDHLWSEFDGNTTPVSRGAKIAASTGMVIVCSAGNAGDDPWYHILAPADADNIITVGAVDSLGVITGFSSRGPSYDGRIKPDICSQGSYTIGQMPNGSFVYAAGTSCSAPLISGMAACLWQSNPQAGYLDVIEAFHKAGDRYFSPDSLYGYGIPDLAKSNILLTNMVEDPSGINTISLFPNPMRDRLYLEVNQPGETGNQLIIVEIYDSMGRLCKRISDTIANDNFVLEIPEAEHLNTGLFLLLVNISGTDHTLRFVKL